MSNNCIYLTSIHMCLYIWRARLRKGGERKAREDSEWRETKYIYLLYICICKSVERDCEREERGKRD